MSVYMDHAAATPLDEDVLEGMQPYFTELFYNPSANYAAAQQVKKALESARSRVAQLLGTRASEIIFTSGATEANNLAIQGLLAQYDDANIVLSAIEHDSVLLPAQRYNYRLAPVSKEGLVDIDALLDLIDDQTVLVSVMYANNEVGTIQPIRQLAQALQVIRTERRKASNDRPLFLHTDAAQASNYLDLHVSRLGVDLLTLNGGKMYGPKASGVLFLASHVRLRPMIVGGGQERDVRSGTENVATCVGFAQALAAAQVIRKGESERLQVLQQEFLKGLQHISPAVVINGSLQYRLPNNVHVTFPGHDNERLLYALDEVGIMAAAGSACSASSDEPSHVLRAMGMSAQDAQSSLRFTMGRTTSKDDIHTVCEALAAKLSGK